MDQPPTDRLKVGIFLPYTEYTMDGHTPRWNDILAIAQRTEKSGVVPR